MPLGSLVNRAGGLRYHARALRWRRLWAPFAREVAAWLAPWSPGTAELVIVGPSGGYNLPLAWCRRFPRLVVVEPDPLARLVLRLRLRRPVAVDRGQYLAAPEGPGLLARHHPGAAFLFSNVIGQRHVLFPEQDDGAHARWRAAFVAAMDGRPWRSFHDAVSAAARPLAEAPLRLARQLAPAALVRRAFGPGCEDWNDHRTFPFLPDRPRTILTWRLDPWCSHLIECLDGPPSSAPPAALPSADGGG